MEMAEEIRRCKRKKNENMQAKQITKFKEKNLMEMAEEIRRCKRKKNENMQAKQITKLGFIVK